MNNHFRIILSFKPLILLLFFSAEILAQQSVIKIPKPVFKNGKFIFYNNQRDIKNVGRIDSVKPDVVAKSQNNNIPLGKANNYWIAGPINLNITTYEPTCGYGNGSIIMQATNGTPPYTYKLSDVNNQSLTQQTGNFPLRSAVNSPYTVTVTDALGVSSTTTVTLADLKPQVQAEISSLIYPGSCTSADGTVVLNPLSGIPPFTYSLDLVNWSSNPTFTNLYDGS